MKKHIARCIPLAALLVGSSIAAAHTRVDIPPPRDNRDGYKPGRTAGFVQPCGVKRSAAQPLTTWPAGSTQLVKWTETVHHDGCFLVEFATSDAGPFQKLTMLKHGNATDSGHKWQTSITLPDVECTDCIFRVRQVMLDGDGDAAPCPPANMKDDDATLYYSCANVKLQKAGGSGSGDASAPADSASPDPSSGTGGYGGTAGTTGGAGSGGSAGSAGAVGSGGSGYGTGGVGGSPTVGAGGAGGAGGTAGTGAATGSPTGTGGATTGAAGSGGAAGTAGTAGTGGSGTTSQTLYGGCAVGASSRPSAPVIVAFALAFVVQGARRRKSPPRKAARGSF
jgi:hypothetical protein